MRGTQPEVARVRRRHVKIARELGSEYGEDESRRRTRPADRYRAATEQAVSNAGTTETSCRDAE